MRPTREQRHQRERHDWLRTSFVAPTGCGHEPNEDDYRALPEEARGKARAIVDDVLGTFDSGHHGAARETAAREFAALEDSIPKDWTPPVEEHNPRELAAPIIERRV